MKNRTWVLGLVASASLLVSGCYDVGGYVKDNSNNAVSISNNSGHTSEEPDKGDEVNQETDEDGLIPLLTIDREHKLTVNQDTIDIVATYGISRKRQDDYLFLSSSFIQLGIKLATDNPRYRIKVSGLHSDVSTNSGYTGFNGIIQDSMDLRFNDSPSGGYDIDSINPYEQLFLVEGVGQNKNFNEAWYGYGYVNEYTYHKITEDNIRYYCNGAVSRTVWNLVIEDTETGKVYNNYVSDEILMKTRISN